MGEKTINRRRDLLKSTLAGGALAGAALPGQWTKPIVDSLTLPAHAVTSGDFFGSGLSSVTSNFDVDGAEQYVRGDSSLKDQLLDTLVPPAAAGIFALRTNTACAISMGDDFLITHQRGNLSMQEPMCQDGLPPGPQGPTYRFNFRRQGLIPKNGDDGDLNLIASGSLCEGPGCNSLTARLVNYNTGDNQLELQIVSCMGGTDTIFIPASNSCNFEDLSSCAKIVYEPCEPDF